MDGQACIFQEHVVTAKELRRKRSYILSGTHTVPDAVKPHIASL